LGGLLGAYSISGDPRLFAAALNAADAILEGASNASPTDIPRPFSLLSPPTYTWDWKANIHRIYKKLYPLGRNNFTLVENRVNSLSGFGSFGLEFSFLSTALIDRRYRKVADSIFRHVSKHEQNGIVPDTWNVETGEPENQDSNLGSGSSSFYDALIKVRIKNFSLFEITMLMADGYF
jgi:hypothetical protein